MARSTQQYKARKADDDEALHLLALTRAKNNLANGVQAALLWGSGDMNPAAWKPSNLTPKVDPLDRAGQA